MKKMNENKKTFIALTIYVICMSLFLLVTMRSESDYYWHIKAGEYMFNHGILKKDVFSWYLYGKYWMSHEWLFEIILYSFKLVFGSAHLLVYGFVCMCSLQFIMFLANKEGYLKNINFSMIWVTLSMILIVYMQGRPHLISFNLLALTIWFLYDTYRNEDSKLIYFLPLISIIWANVHGGSSNLTYIFCFIFLIVGLFNFNRPKIYMDRLSKKQMLKYLIIAIICMLCVNINIHGFKMFVYPYQNMMNKVMINNIAEWLPTNLNFPGHWVYMLIVVFIFFVMIFSKKKISFIDLALFGISIVLGFKNIRFWGYTYIIMSFVIFNYVGKRKLDIGTNTILIIVSVMLVAFFCLSTNNIHKQLNSGYLVKKDIEAIKKVKPKRLFNMYNYGGELIYNDIPVFIDGRADLYSNYNYLDYLSISDLRVNYIDLIEKYDFDYLLVSNQYSIDTYLKNNSDYEQIYENKEIILYKKIVN